MTALAGRDGAGGSAPHWPGEGHLDGLPDRLTLTPLALIALIALMALMAFLIALMALMAFLIAPLLTLCAHRSRVRACVHVSSLCLSPSVMMVTSDRGWSAHDGAVDAAAAEQLTREQHELLTASSALEGVLVRTVSEASTLELVKHHLLMISLEALDDLNERFSNERVVGFVANPSAMPSSVVAALASGKSSSAQQATSS